MAEPTNLFAKGSAVVLSVGDNQCTVAETVVRIVKSNHFRLASSQRRGLEAASTASEPALHKMTFPLVGLFDRSEQRSNVWARRCLGFDGPRKLVFRVSVIALSKGRVQPYHLH